MFPLASDYLTGQWINAWTGGLVATVVFIVLPLAASELLPRKLRIGDHFATIICLLGAALMVVGVAWMAFGDTRLELPVRLVGSFETGQWPVVVGLVVYLVGLVVALARRGQEDRATTAYMFGFLGTLYSVVLINLLPFLWRGSSYWFYSQGPWKALMFGSVDRLNYRFPDWIPDWAVQLWPDLVPQYYAATRGFGMRNELTLTLEPSFLLGGIVGILPFVVIGTAAIVAFLQLRRRGRIPWGVVGIGAAIPLIVAALVGIWVDQEWPHAPGVMFGIGASLLAPLVLARLIESGMLEGARRRAVGAIFAPRLEEPQETGISTKSIGTLEQQILERVSSGDTRLSVSILAEEYNVSTAEIREAIRSLAKKGLIRL